MNFDLFHSNSDVTKEILFDVFGFENFRGQQEKIVNHIYRGEDAFVLMPTGGGKSLCYQIPALARSGMGVVISPLISLMQDQVNALRDKNINARFLNSTLSFDEVLEIEREIRSNNLDILYLSPERFSLVRTQELLKSTEISLFAIDEAHCISKWGHDFRPEYMQLGRLLHQFSNIPKVALTATADLLTRKEIITKLNLKDSKIFLSSFDRPNITYLIEKKKSIKGSFDQLLGFLSEFNSSDSGIVYCLSRKKVEEVSEFLNQNGHKALPYHAGLSSSVRQRHQDRFIQQKGVIVVATIAFGMGIDKPDVRFVAHMDLPKSIEGYYQETGRAGRDGKPSVAWMAYGLREVTTLKMLIRKGTKDFNHRLIEEMNLETMLSICETTVCRRKSILNNLDEETSDYCGNCDICLGSLEREELYDGSEEALLLLTLIYKTKQRFRFSFLLDILQGESSQCEQYPHFGDGSHLGFKAWSYVFRQLIAANMVKIDYERGTAVCLTQQSLSLIKREIKLYFKEDPNSFKETKKSSSKKVSKKKTQARKKKTVKRKQYRVKTSVSSTSSNRDLFDSLKDLRKKIAKKRKLAAYKVFHDSALLEMANKKPSSDEEFLDINGVGPTKLKKYGDQFMELISEF